ncbi:MAG: hypothetical protein VCC19_12225 [Myxococcota bacterium]
MQRDESAGGESRFSGLLAVAVAVLVSSLVWQRYHSAPPDPRLFAPTDLANYYYPIADVVGRRLAAGDLPLWNPVSCSGIPLLASLQPAVLYPFTWLSIALPTADALWAGLWVQILMAGAFTAAALRAGGAHWAAAGLGGVFYVHACLLGNLAWPPSVSTMTWLPLLWLCVEKLARQLRFGWWAVLSVATGLQLLAGFPQYLVYGFYWLVPYTAILLWRGAPRGERAGRALWMLLAVALGVGLAAAQLLPTAELAGESARGQRLTVAEVHYLDVGTLPAKKILSNALDPQPKNPTFDLKAGTGYLGVASVFAVVAMLWLRGRSLRTAYLVAAGLLALLLSDGFLGVASPLFRVYHELPTGGLFRMPERLRFITMICLVALASGGLDAMLRHRDEKRPIALLVAMCAAAVAVVLVGGPGVGWRALVALTLVILLLLGPSLFGSAGASLRTVAACVWVAFVSLDLWLATAPAGVLHAYPRQLSEQYQAAFKSARIEDALFAELLATPGFARVEPHGFFPFNAAGGAYGLHRSACYEPLAPGQWRSLSEVLSPERKLRGGLANPNPKQRPVFYDVAAVSTIVRPRRGVAVPQANPDALPRAYLVEAATRATQAEAFLHIRDGSFDFHRGVLLEGEIPANPANPRPATPARILSHEPERVEIAVRAERDAWLVLADTFYPGWNAEVAGERLPIRRANGLYRAIRVPAGDQTVVFSYQPTSFRAGVALSCVSALAIFGITVAGRRGLFGRGGLG